LKEASFVVEHPMEAVSNRLLSCGIIYTSSESTNNKCIKQVSIAELWIEGEVRPMHEILFIFLRVTGLTPMEVLNVRVI